MSSSNFSIEKFDGKGSFTLWQRRVKDLFIQQGLAKVLKGKEKGKPQSMTDGDWEELEKRCVSTIRLCIADNIVNNVIEDESAASIWEKLENLYLAKGLTNKLLLKRKLYRLKMREKANLVEHLNEFMGVLGQLEKVDIKIDDEEKAIVLLSSLPDSYEQYVQTILWGKEKITLSQAQEALISHDLWNKSKGDQEVEDALVFRRGGSYEKGGSRRGRSKSKIRNLDDVQCYKCKGFGHIKKNCPKGKGKDKEQEDEGTSLVTGEYDEFH